MLAGTCTLKMVFKFVCPKEKVQFFQSSFPYLNNNSLSYYNRGRTRKWTLDEPHPSSQRILSIANGHYGIYFTIFNQELRREEPSPPQRNHLIVMLVPPLSQFSFMPDFFISRANQEIHNNISELKNLSRELLSMLALVKPKKGLKVLCQKRHLSRKAAEISPEPIEKIEISAEPLEKIAPQKLTGATNVEHAQQILNQDELAESTGNNCELSQPFEESFQKSQVAQIVHVFNTHSDPSELNIVYPLYQSLKRNGIPLPSIETYNMVLQSILLRSLDNDSTLESIESRLTCLLTVYLDILSVCPSVNFKPNYNTYNLVLQGILQGCVDTINLGYVEADSFVKSQEFCQVGANLFVTLESSKLDLNAILPNFVTALNVHPNLLTKELAQKLVEPIASESGLYYVGIIGLSKYFRSLNILSKEETFDFVSSVYAQYKSSTANFRELLEYEYDVYATLIQAMVLNENLPMATKFLDNVLIEFKQALSGVKNVSLLKQNISSLISVYLEANMEMGSEGLARAYTLLQKFKSVSYIPEPTVQLYSEMIKGFINHYSLLEIEKASRPDKLETISLKQVTIYNTMWELYENAAIRKDFQSGPSFSPKAVAYTKKINCRDFLMSISIDLNDHSKVFRLLKEIMLKNHVIDDWNVSKKLCHYLHNGIVANDNGYYRDLLWNVIEQQSSHYESRSLHTFLSEHVQFLSLNLSPVTLHRIVNSMMVNNAFSKFLLKEDNIYGLMSVSGFLMRFSSENQLSALDLFKVLQFQSFLINEFEDTENHYLQLSEELVQFREHLSNSFASLYALAPRGFHITSDIKEACRSLNLEFLDESIAQVSESDFQLDLSLQLSINYVIGTSRFLEAFKLGHTFNELTWKLIINRNFVMDTLENDSVVRISDFVGRLLDLGLGKDVETRLLTSLISMNNEKVNIELLKHCLKHENVLADESMLVQFMDFAAVSQNRYFLKLFTDNFDSILALNNSKLWIGMFFSKLISVGKLQEVYAIVQSDYRQFVENLDIRSTAGQEYLNVVLLSLLNLKKDVEIDAIFKHFFSGADANEILVPSDNLLSSLINYHILTGSYESVVQKFESVESRSLELKQLIGFAEFMSSLEGKGFAHRKSRSKNEDVNTVALALLSESDLGGMRDVYDLKSLFVKSKQRLFDSMVVSLTKASTLSDGSYVEALNKKFESSIKFCKYMGLKYLSVLNLIHIIRFLAITKSRETLNVLFNKFVNGTSLAPIVNFYFLQVEISDPNDSSRLLKEFKRALVEVEDELNLAVVSEYENSML